MMICVQSANLVNEKLEAVVAGFGFASCLFTGAGLVFAIRKYNLFVSFSILSS